MSDLTEIVCVVDRSGSMESIKNDAIGGFNQFLEEQKKTGVKSKMTVAQFDNYYELLYDGVDINSVNPYTPTTYLPRGTTALYDAVGKTISTIIARQSKQSENEKTNKVLFMILTDGHENSSKEYSMEAIKKLIDQQKIVGWEFIFVAAGIDSFDAVAIGSGMGVGVNNIHTGSHTGAGMNALYSSLSKAAVSFCATGSIGDWKVDEQSTANNRKIKYSG